MNRWRTLEVATLVFGTGSAIEALCMTEIQGVEVELQSGQDTAAAEHLLRIATDLELLGLPQIALAAIEDFRTRIPETRLRPALYAWAGNIEGLAHAALGDLSRAEGLFQGVLQTGRRLGDAQLIATALQNLGAQAARRGEHKRAADLANEAVGLKLRIGDRYGASQVLINLGASMLHDGQPEASRALLSDVEPIVRGVRSSHLMASWNGVVGQTYAAEGQLDQARTYFNRALRAARRDRDAGWIALALQNLGALELDAGRPGLAVRRFRRAIREVEALDVPPQLETLYRSLALALHRSGRDREAVAWLEKARGAAIRFHQRELWAGATADLGATQIALGDLGSGIQNLQEAIDAFEGIGDTHALRQALANLSTGYDRAGKVGDAVAALDRAMRIQDDCAVEDRMAILDRLVILYIRAEEYEKATDVLTDEIKLAELISREQAAWIAIQGAARFRDASATDFALTFFELSEGRYRSLRDFKRVFDARNDKALALIDAGRLEDGLKELRSALAVGRRLKDRSIELQARSNIGETLRRLGRLGWARRELRAAVDLARDLEDPSGQASALALEGLGALTAGDYPDAERAFRESLRISDGVSDNAGRIDALGGLANLNYLGGDYTAAAEFYRASLGVPDGMTRPRFEDACGLLRSLAASADRQELGKTGQLVVDLAQELGTEEEAATAFIDAGDWFARHRRLRTAAPLYATALVLAVTSLRPFLEGTGPPDFEFFAFVVLRIIGAEKTLHSGELKVWRSVWRYIDREYPDLAGHLRPMVDSVAAGAPEGIPPKPL